MPGGIEHRHSMSLMHEFQVSVPMDAALRRFLEEAAAREHRTLAGQVRHLVSEAAARLSQQERAA